MTFERNESGGVPRYFKDVAVGDVDNDGDLDIWGVKLQEVEDYLDNAGVLFINQFMQNGTLLINATGDDERIATVWYAGYTPGILLGIAEELTTIQDSNAPTRQAAIDALSGLMPAGATPIGHGLLRGQEELDEVEMDPAQEASRPVLIRLSDGLESVVPFWGDTPSGLGYSPPAADKAGEFFQTQRPATQIDSVLLGPDADAGSMSEIAAQSANRRVQEV